MVSPSEIQRVEVFVGIEMPTCRAPVSTELLLPEDTCIRQFFIGGNFLLDAVAFLNFGFYHTK
jgi:hypothetical protein